MSIDVVGGEEVKEWQETTVRSFTLLAGVVLFFGILAAMCALLCSEWALIGMHTLITPPSAMICTLSKLGSVLGKGEGRF